MARKEDPRIEVDLRDILNELSSAKNKLDRLEQQNTEIQLLLRILVQPILWNSLKTIFTKPKQLWAYELSDGNRSTRDIGRIISVDQKTISTWWRTWSENYKIVEKTGKRGQFKKLYNLLDLVLLYSYEESQNSSMDA